MGARILTARPWWDPEVTEDGLRLLRPLIFGCIDQDLSLVEEACQALECRYPASDFPLSLSVTRVTQVPLAPPPPSLGPWAIIPLEGSQEELPEDSALFWPPFLRPSHRLWAGAALATTMLLEHLDAPPGAPETKGGEILVLESGAPPLSLVASLAGGASQIALVADEGTCAAAQAVFMANGRSNHLNVFHSPLKNLTALARKQSQWENYFRTIVVHLSPYLVARYLKTLSSWLTPSGAIIVAGFTPGRETAHLLRAAARAGLALSTSIIEDDWVALKLVSSPLGQSLPPLTGSLVPDLVDVPSLPNSEHISTESIPDPNDTGLDDCEDTGIDDCDSLIFDDDENIDEDEQ